MVIKLYRDHILKSFDGQDFGGEIAQFEHYDTFFLSQQKKFFLSAKNIRNNEINNSGLKK